MAPLCPWSWYSLHPHIVKNLLNQMWLSQDDRIGVNPGDLNSQIYVDVSLISDVKQVGKFCEDGANLLFTWAAKDPIIDINKQNCRATVEDTFVNLTLPKLQLVDEAIDQVLIPYPASLFGSIEILNQFEAMG